MVQQIEKTTIDLSGGSQIEMTYEAFSVWFDEGHIGEWVDGKVIEFMPPTLRHQAIADLLYSLLSWFVASRKLGRVVSAPFEMKIRSGGSYRIPDIVYISSESRHRLTVNRIDGPADLAVEVVSDSSIARDRTIKMFEYASSGVAEYWLVDARPNRFEFRGYSLTSDGYYADIPVGLDGILESKLLPGLRLAVDWFSSDQIAEFPFILSEFDPNYKP